MKIEIPAAKKLVYTMRFPVRWGDMDAMGHVNNTVYFRYLESARIEWMVLVGCKPDPKGAGACHRQCLLQLLPAARISGRCAAQAVCERPGAHYV